MTHEDNLLAEWLNHPGCQVAKDRVAAEVKRRSDLLAVAIIKSENPIDQRAVDRQRGFGEGAEWFLREAKRGERAFKREQGGEQV